MTSVMICSSGAHQCHRQRPAEKGDILFIFRKVECPLLLPLDRSKIIVYEVKTNADGLIGQVQLDNLIQVQGAPIREYWSPVKWDRPSNSLTLNELYKKALAIAKNLPSKEVVKVGAVAGVFLTLSTARQAIANFRQESLQLSDDKTSSKPAIDIKLQETKLVSMFGDLVNGFTGGTLGDYVNATLLWQVYKRLLPVLSQGQ